MGCGWSRLQVFPAFPSYYVLLMSYIPTYYSVLPSGWEPHTGIDGRTYYVNYSAGTTHCNPPPMPAAPRAHTESGESDTKHKENHSSVCLLPSPPEVRLNPLEQKKYMCCLCKNWRKRDQAGNCFKCGHTACSRNVRGWKYSNTPCGEQRPEVKGSKVLAVATIFGY